MKKDVQSVTANGFNGKENDTKWGNQLIQDYGFRLYNPAIGKFLSVDPLAPEYAFYSPYHFAGNSPIANIDLDGLEPTRAGHDHTRVKMKPRGRQGVPIDPQPIPVVEIIDGITMPFRAAATGIHVFGSGVLKIPEYAQGNFSGGAPSYYDFMNFRWNKGGTYQSEQTMKQMSYEAISNGAGTVVGVGISGVLAKFMRGLSKGKGAARNFKPTAADIELFGNNAVTKDGYDKAMELFIEGAKGKGGVMAFGNDAAVAKVVLGYIDPVDGVVDIHIHKELWDLKDFVIKQDGQAIKMSIEAMAKKINKLYPTASHIRLFTCYGDEVASRLAKLTNKKVLSNSGKLSVTDRGYYIRHGRVQITDEKGTTSVIKQK